MVALAGVAPPRPPAAPPTVTRTVTATSGDSVHADAAGTGGDAQPNQTEAKAPRLFLAVPKVKDWVGRYPKASLVKQATYDAAVRATGT